MRSSLLSIGVLVTAATLAACTPSVTPGPSPSSSASMASSVPAAVTDITVSQPVMNAQVSSPLTVAGQAKGSWYFEAQFPIRLLDSSGNQIASTTAQAQGNWMTTSFVPFTATLTYTTNSATGTLILEKDNPSGEPQNAASISIPVTF